MSLTLYDSAISGNAYKVRLALTQLRRPCRVVPLDLLAGDARAPAFRTLNPFGRVPFLTDGDFGLAESNAILHYLLRGTPLWPADPKAEARALQWMFFEQNQVELALGVSRYLRRFAPDAPGKDGILEYYRPRARAALKILDAHLGGHAFFTGERYGAADIALYAYTHLAEEAGFPLAEFPAVRAWFERVRAQPRHLRMEDPFDGAVT